MGTLKALFGRRVALIRKHQGLTQKALAEESELSPYTIAKLETGVVGPSIETIELLSRILDVEPAAFFEGEAGRGHQAQALRMLMAKLSELNPRQLEWTMEVVSILLHHPDMRTDVVREERRGNVTYRYVRPPPKPR